MNYKKAAVTGALVISMSALAGCGVVKTSIDAPPPGSNEANVAKAADSMPMTLYFSDANGYVVPMKMALPKSEGVAKTVLDSMIASPQTVAMLAGTDLKPVIPAGTKLSVNIKEGGLAVVDFSKEIETLKTAQDEQRMVDAVVWALTEFPNVKDVQFTIQGQTKATLPHHTPIGQPLSRDNGINLEVASNINPTNTDRVTVYLEGQNSKGDFHYLIPVTRVIAKTGADTLTNTVNQLVKGPWSEDKGLQPTLSPQTKLLSAKVQDGVATLDFSDSLMTSGATPEQKKLFDALVLSVTDSAHVQKVMITVNGKAPKTADGLDLSKPVDRPQFVNQKQL